MSSTDPTPDPAGDTDTASAPVPAPEADNRLVAYGLAAAGSILFATKAVAIKLAYVEPIDASTLLAMRMILAFPFYLAIGAFSLRDRITTGRGLPTRRQFAAVAGVGLLGYWVSSYLDFLGLEYVSAQVERMILFTYPMFVIIFGALFFGQPASRRAIIAIAISYAGLAIIFAHGAAEGGSDAIVGSILVLGAAIVFALYQLFAKGLIGEIGPRLFTCIAMIVAGIGAVGQFFLTHPAADLVATPRLWLIALFLAIGATVLPSFLINAALHRISAQANATIGTLSPVATILLAWVILGETLSLAAWVGTALVLLGVGWYTLGNSRKT